MPAHGIMGLFRDRQGIRGVRQRFESSGIDANAAIVAAEGRFA
jgi:hypothetical protein